MVYNNCITIYKQSKECVCVCQSSILHMYSAHTIDSSNSANIVRRKLETPTACAKSSRSCHGFSLYTPLKSNMLVSGNTM